MKFSKDEQLYLDGIEHMPELYDHERQRIVEVRDAFKSAINSSEGKQLITWMLNESRLLLLSTGADGSVEFNEGKRAVGLALLEQIVLADEEGWIKIQREHLDKFNAMIEVKK